MVASMTAFANSSIDIVGGTLSAEMRSVNHRYLDVNVRLPEVLRQSEMSMRQQIKRVLARGKVDLYITFQVGDQALNGATLNQSALSDLLGIYRSLDDVFTGLTVSFHDLINSPGLLHAERQDEQALQSDVSALLTRVLSDLVDVRQREGEALVSDIMDRLQVIKSQVLKVREALPEIENAQRLHIKERFEQADIVVDPERFEQEVVWCLQKMDVEEELQRLAVHLEEFERILKKGGVIGRRLDFLSQELNREANTLASKSVSSVVTLAAVEIKVYIEQIREQVQNIE